MKKNYIFLILNVIILCLTGCSDSRDYGQQAYEIFENSAKEIITEKSNTDGDKYDEEYSSYVENNSIYTVEEARDRGMDYGILQTDGLVRSINRYTEFGDKIEPVPSDIRICDGEKLIAISTDRFYGLCKAKFVNISAYTLTYDHTNGRLDFGIYNNETDTAIKAWKDNGILSESDKDIVYNSRLSWHDRLYIEEVDGIDVSGMNEKELLSFLDENAIYSKQKMYDKEYSLSPVPHTFGYYEGTEYKEVTLDTTLWCVWGTITNEHGNELEYVEDSGIIKTHNGYFIIDISNVPSGLYENPNSNIYINVIQ